ncbi:fatty acid desaturase [Haloplasma contractile]|uniref:Fatty acid desaturase protein n=1 Tax=Haloplasma contractile SSD-17B TaxID=1033810 RepID=U2E6S3_9MOLU|nr:fatty acid desaturase [Haloplasma contractile]ERJ10918.1 Fatty acid desaturase protein [Haloplasma contractile SSD-17B]
MKKDNTQQLRRQIKPYEQSYTVRSILQLVNTVIPFFVSWTFAYLSLSISYFLSLLFIILSALMLIRIFIIFHDCCHNSFFKRIKTNQLVGTILGVLTVFPYSQWKRNHNTHHATSGNLDKRGVGDLWILTVNEYNDASTGMKVKYRLYRNPIIMFFIGPIYEFLIKQRFNQRGVRLSERLNTYLINIMILTLYTVLILTIGWQSFLLIQLPVFLISGSLGIWLFFIQHQFEDSYFKWNKEWEFVKAAVEGSSFYRLPKLLQWVTGNIGYHHVHHLSPTIPNYNLETAHKNSEALKHVPTVTLRSSLKSIKFKLWDEVNSKFLTFKEYKKLKLTK